MGALRQRPGRAAGHGQVRKRAVIMRRRRGRFVLLTSSDALRGLATSGEPEPMPAPSVNMALPLQLPTRPHRPPQPQALRAGGAAAARH